MALGESQRLSLRMLAYLKKLYRAKGLRLCDVAELIGVSQRSIKRYMKGFGVSLDLLERLCDVADVTILELAELAEGDAESQVLTNSLQEDALAEDTMLSIAFYLLSFGWAAQRVAQEFFLSDFELNRILLRLDALGLITLYCENRFKVRARVRSPQLCSPSLRNQVLAGVRSQLEKTDLDGDNTLWGANMVRMGPDSFERVRTRIASFIDEVVELSKYDKDLDGQQVRWFGVCALLAPEQGVEYVRARARTEAARQTSHLGPPGPTLRTPKGDSARHSAKAASPGMR